jgi:hypothetical protein
VAWNKGDRKISPEVDIPKAADVQADLSSEELRDKKRISLTGQAFVVEELRKVRFDIPAGKHNLKFD